MNERPDEALLVETSQLTLVSADANTGLPDEARLPFAYDDGVVYLLARPESEWYRNVQKDQGVVVRIRHRGFRGRVKLPGHRKQPGLADRVAAMFLKKYGGTAPGKRERDRLLPLAVDLEF